MSKHTVRWWALALGSVVGMAGCNCCGKKQCCPPPARPACPPATQTVPPAQPILPAPPGPGPGGPAPGATVPGPAPAWPPPSSPAPAPGTPGPVRYYWPTGPAPAWPSPSSPAPAAGTPGPARYYYSPNYQAPADSRWEPADRPAIRLAPPESVPADRKVPNASSVAKVDFACPASGSLDLTPALPVGIPQFAAVERGISAGLKPDLDGLDWLKAHGFRTVVQVRALGQDDSADRRQVEKRGLKFVSLECASGTFSRALVEEFGRLTLDPKNQAVFVYDRDGALAGSLWYLHFVLNQRLPDADARSRASRLGFREATAPAVAARQLLGRQ